VQLGPSFDGPAYTFTVPANVFQNIDVLRAIYGSNLSDATAVLFVVPPSGGSAGQTITVNPASQSTPGFTINPDGSITVTVPALGSTPPSGGLTVDIRVQTPEGTTGITTADQFVFTPTGAAPTVTALSTQTGLTTGGQLVTISFDLLISDPPPLILFLRFDFL